MRSIENCRIAARISKKSMAKTIGVSMGEYERLENYINEMSISQAMVFAKTTKTPINEIIFFAD